MTAPLDSSQMMTLLYEHWNSEYPQPTLCYDPFAGYFDLEWRTDDYLLCVSVLPGQTTGHLLFAKDHHNLDKQLDFDLADPEHWLWVNRVVNEHDWDWLFKLNPT